MSKNYHPLIQKTKVELERLDMQKHVSWEEWRKFNSNFLPIHTEAKLRRRALMFMDKLVKKLEENNHVIKFEYERCHIKMYGQLTEINLRQKYFRKRIKNDDSDFSTNTYEKSNKLEFQVGSHARKGWIDGKKKSLEDYHNVIYEYIEKDSLEWAKLRKRQKFERELQEAQRKIDEQIAAQKVIEQEKFNKLLSNAENYRKANIIRSYLKAYEAKSLELETSENEINDYLKWAFRKADEIDPLC